MNQRIWVVLTMILCLCGSNAFAQNSFVQLTKAKKDKLKAQANSLNQEIEKIDREIDKIDEELDLREEMCHLGYMMRNLDEGIAEIPWKNNDGDDITLVYYKDLGAYMPKFRFKDPKLFEQLDRIQARADAKILSQCGSGEMNEAAKRTADRIQAKANAEKKRLVKAKYQHLDYSVKRYKKGLEKSVDSMKAKQAKLETELKAKLRTISDDSEEYYESWRGRSLKRYVCEFYRGHLLSVKSASQAGLSRVQKELSNFPYEKYQQYDLLYATVPLKNGSNVHVYLIPPKYVKVPVEKLNGITKNHILPIQDGKNWLAIRPNFLFKGQKYYVVYSSQELIKEHGMTKQEIKKQDQLVLKKIGGTGLVYEYDGNYFADDGDGKLIKYNNRGELRVIGDEDELDLIRKKGRLVR